MLVKERMSYPVITIHPKLPMQDALSLMLKEQIRRLPIVDKHGRLIGIVSERDLLHASPSNATSLNIWELNYLLSKTTVAEIMTSNVISINEDTPIEEAARIMADNKIGGLTVVRDDKVVGIITETDLFKIFLELLGAREPGIRLAAMVPNEAGELAQLTTAIFNAGGNILALGTFLGESSENREVTIKVSGINAQELKKAVDPFIDRIVDMRSTK
ncbi:MAG: CBS domain-containing protein [Anaerolineales bacterium]|nr:CBS domain-containing protein [Anaerolineales bacterium]